MLYSLVIEEKWLWKLQEYDIINILKEFGNHIFKINLNFQFSGLELAHESLEGLRSTSLLSMKKLVVSKHKANVMSQSKGFMLLLLTFAVILLMQNCGL